jgi:hypothetical protein
MTSFYQQTAAQFIEIDETDEGQLFCTIPSEKDVNARYTLECEESATSVEVKSCNCKGHQYTGHCKHQEVVQSFWNRIYKSNAVKAEQKEQAAKAEAEMQAVKDQEKLAMAIKQTPVAAAPVITDLSKKGNLNTSRAFHMMR